MIIINFKNYKTGMDALKLSRKIEKYLSSAIIAVSSVDIFTISKKSKLKVYAQHSEPYEGKRFTGYNLMSVLKKAGAKGTIINHSEHPISKSKISEIIFLSKKLKIKVIACVSIIKDVSWMLRLRPYAIAFEEPSLISSGKSITDYKPKKIKKFLDITKGSGIISLCGAGISNIKDVKKAKKLGCDGVLIASSIAKVKNPDNFLRELYKNEKEKTIKWRIEK